MSYSLLTETKNFLNEPLRHFINNQWRNSVESEDFIDVIDPSTGQKIASVVSGDANDVELAVSAAHNAFQTWSETSADQRAELLKKLANTLDDNLNVLAQLESLDVGKAIVNASGFDIPFGIECVRYYADLATQATYQSDLNIDGMDAHIHRAPYGACGFIFPWNFPFDLLMWNIMPALAAGNTVVLKPAELTPLTTLYVCKLAKEVGIPDGVINAVIGTGQRVGSPIVQHPKIRRMSFTGSSNVGKQIAAMCGERPIPCKVELGGKGAAVVFDDANIDNAAEQLANAITLNSGQVCCTATRWIIHENVYDEFVNKVISILKATQIGPGLAEETQMGPVVSQAQKDTVLGYLDKGLSEGATLLYQGNASVNASYKEGYYVAPYLLEGLAENVCFKEEIFGPTAYLVKFSTEEEALNLVNSLDYGLANSVFSEDLTRCYRIAEKMISGNSWINAHNVFAYGLPYGGVNKSGLGGGVNSPETFYDYLRPLTIARPIA
ncbi:aldehyde dehydrogenase family protein [Neptuniibacter pectenicola]|uniref:aldehyde dehydrogenase family protein n=1 Tax=Neptuniibacter pectenicola TaxID=1806669 RepID=UPI003F4B0905